MIANIKQTASIALTCLGTMIGAGISVAPTDAEAKSQHGYPVCLYSSEAAYGQRSKKDRACFRLGDHRDPRSEYYNRITSKGVGYVDVKLGYRVTLSFFNGSSSSFTSDGSTYVESGNLKGVKIVKVSEPNVGGYPVCLYGSGKAYLKKDKYKRACFPFGEYPTLSLEQFRFFNDQAEWADLRSGFKVILWQHANFKGKSKVMNDDGEIKGALNGEVSSVQVVRK